MKKDYQDISVEVKDKIAVIEIQRPPHNFFDEILIGALASALEDLDQNPDCFAIMLASQGKNFCAGANFGYARGETSAKPNVKPLYSEAARIFACKKPIIAAIQGSAIGGGLGLALIADFRVASAETRFAANFVKLGIHPGFGLTYTLPLLIGRQKALWMFLSGARLNGEEAHHIGLVDFLTSNDNLRTKAMEVAGEIASNAPLAVESTRATMRGNLLGGKDFVSAFQRHTDHESTEQNRLFQTKDHEEGVKAVSERRAGIFHRQ